MTKGILAILSAPSGVGKTTIIQRVMAADPNCAFAVSHTTRAPRKGEVDGRDYYFVDNATFGGLVAAGAFAEWAHVHGKYYGTDGEQIEEWLIDGEDVLLDIDVQGARQVRCAHPQAHTIFILPPSLEALEERLRGRGTESREQMATRLAAARREIQEAHWYDYIVVNDIVQDAAADLQAIFRSCRYLRRLQLERVRPYLVAH